jgi:hypothetical protein
MAVCHLARHREYRAGVTVNITIAAIAVSVLSLVVTFGRKVQGERVATILAADLRQVLTRKS